MKVIFACIAFLFALTTGWASPLNDTTKHLLIADNTDGYCIEILPANVSYPELLAAFEPETKDYIEQFSKTRRDYLIRMYQKSKRYFTRIETIFSKYDVPHEFCVLIALESAFNPNAISRAGAVGYWQFMDKVAREYGLKTQPLSQLRRPVKRVKGKPVATDDRKNFIKSTHAAGKYLRDRARNLNNDWLLMAASYNWGVGNVMNSLQRTGKENPTFWDIKKYMPAETRTYVMNFIAMNVIFHNYEAFYRNELRFRDQTIKVPISPTPQPSQVM